MSIEGMIGIYYGGIIVSLPQYMRMCALRAHALKQCLAQNPLITLRFQGVYEHFFSAFVLNRQLYPIGQSIIYGESGGGSVFVIDMPDVGWIEHAN